MAGTTVQFPPQQQNPPTTLQAANRVINERVNQRMAARTTIRQTSVNLRRDAAAARIKIIVEGVWIQLMKLLTRETINPESIRSRAFQIGEKMRTDIFRSLSLSMQRFTRWAYDSQYQIFVDVVPRIYWSVATPAIEAVNFSGSKDVAGAKSLYDPPSAAEIQQAINDTITVDGINWIERLEKKYGTIPGDLANTITAGMVAGENPRKVAKKIQPLINSSAARAQTIARTETARIANQMQMKVYEDLEDMIAGFMLDETLDERTRPEHQARSGTIFWKGDRQPNVSEMPQLPDVPNCRGTYSAVLIPPSEVLADIGKNSPVASIEGPIQDPKTYANWFNGLGEGGTVFIRNPKTGRRIAEDGLEAKRMIVGPRRWREVERKLEGIRTPEWEDFHNDKGELVSLKDLKRENVSDMAARRSLVQQFLAEREANIAAALSLAPELGARILDRGLKMDLDEPEENQ